MVTHNKFIYIHMPKTGGTFVSVYLQDNIPNAEFFGPGYGHQPVKNERLRFPNHFMFGTVRNPWDWYVSMYEFNKPGGAYDKFINKSGTDFNKFITLLLTKTVGTASRIRFNKASALGIGMCTYQYILLFSNNPDEVFNKITKDWQIGTDKILKIEDIKTELPKMFAEHIFELNVSQKEALTNMKRLNTSKREGKHYREYYTEETKKLVQEKDRVLIEQYNYTF